MATPDPKSIVLRSIDLYNDHPPEVYVNENFLDLYADDCVAEFAATPQAPARRTVGKQALRELVASNSQWCRDGHSHVHEATAEDGRVAVRYTWTGVVTRDVPGFAAGTKIRADGADFCTVRDGLIVEVVDVMGPIMVAESDGGTS